MPRVGPGNPAAGGGVNEKKADRSGKALAFGPLPTTSSDLSFFFSERGEVLDCP
ncbi:hypothetical protein [Aquiflexum sp.]|uniref:hypothetical protein n=1 Tax=Aquiflexum sp. TaxID=1872584 RepID=UPI003593474E